MIVIADTSSIISLALIDKLNLLTIFGEVYIPYAVWDELNNERFIENSIAIKNFFKNKVKKISSYNNLLLIMDYGESEGIYLYKELNADYLIIDDKKSRAIAEELNINCIGTIGILIRAKQKGLIKKLRPIFEILLKKKRYYSKLLLNDILKEFNERLLDL